MDIGVPSIVMSKSNVQESATTEVMKLAMVTEKENTNLVIHKTDNFSFDPNLGQNLDVIAGEQVDKDEELNKQLDKQVQQELKWAQDRQKMLNVKEVKMLQIREIEEQGKQLSSLTLQEQKKLNDRLNNLEAQVSAIDSESRRTKDGKKLE